MRLNQNPNKTIEVIYQNKKFIYSQSNKKIINPRIDIKLALKNCFREERIKTTCFFHRKKANILWKMKLKPKYDFFYQTASETQILQKALIVIFSASFEDAQVVKICLELTRLPWYQSLEWQHLQRKQNTDQGYLSRLKTAQQTAKRLYKIFQLYYKDLYCDEIEESIKSKKHVSPRQSPLAIYPLSKY